MGDYRGEALSKTQNSPPDNPLGLSKLDFLETESNRLTLQDYVRTLLQEGKRSTHPDFQKLIGLYGKEKISEIARAVLKELEKVASE